MAPCSQPISTLAALCPKAVDKPGFECAQPLKPCFQFLNGLRATVKQQHESWSDGTALDPNTVAVLHPRNEAMRLAFWRRKCPVTHVGTAQAARGRYVHGRETQQVTLAWKEVRRQERAGMGSLARLDILIGIIMAAIDLGAGEQGPHH